MTQPSQDPALYRAAVGIVIFNPKGEVWLGKRYGHKGRYSWQFPQGGIDKGEKPKMAAYRELFEETGITREMVQPLGHIKDWLYYDLPAGHTKSWVGQKQRWFAVHYDGPDRHFDLEAHGVVEFSKFKWVALETVTTSVIPFKKQVYKRIVKEFAKYATPPGA